MVSLFPITSVIKAYKPKKHHVNSK